MNVTGKVAVVTGGTKGIGYAIAEVLAKAGASVFISSRTREDIETAVAALSEIGTAAGKLCDVRDEGQVRAMLESCEKRFGGVDILINNAGMGFFDKTVEEMSGDEFRQTLETNLFGVFYACHHAIPLMKRRGGGYI